MTISSDEPELRALMLAGLDGDEASHKSLLTKLSAYLRAYFKTHLARIGKGPADAEDLVQETLIALHTRRHTYDRSQLLTPWVYAIARYASRAEGLVALDQPEELIVKTDELIEMLGTNVEPVKGGQLRNGLLIALTVAMGTVAAICLTWGALGMPSDAQSGEH